MKCIPVFNIAYISNRGEMVLPVLWYQGHFTEISRQNINFAIFVAIFDEPVLF